MSVIRVNKTENYTVMSNHHLRNKNLSLKAKGLLSFMLSLPDNWNYSIAGLCSLCKENETAIKSTIKELKENGYVIVDKKYPEKGERNGFEYIYNIYEFPQEVDDQDVESQGIENLPIDNLSVENQGKINTKELNTDILNINRQSKDEINTDNKYAFSKEKEDDIYASFPEEKEVRVSKKESRYIPKDYTEEQLVKHIIPVISDYVDKKYGYDYDSDNAVVDTIVNIVVEFHREYEKQFHAKHKILSDKAYENIVDRYMMPPDIMESRDCNDLDTYLALMEKYFEIDYNKQGKYKGKVNLSLSHFMSDEIRSHLFYQTCY